MCHLCSWWCPKEILAKETHSPNLRQEGKSIKTTLNQFYTPSHTYYMQSSHCYPCWSYCRPGGWPRRLWIWGLWGLIWCKFSSICSYTCMVYYIYFSVISIALLCLLFWLAWWVVPVGMPAKIDSLLLDQVLTQKLCNNLDNVHNNNKIIFQNIRNAC